jgi:transcriptional regulator GlxA family with amidase domain
MFEPAMDHGDGVIQETQKWLNKHLSVPSPIEQAVRQSGIAERSFKRRFKNATGHTPIDYVQRLRVDEAKQRLERTTPPIDEIGWQVGYEDPTFLAAYSSASQGCIQTQIQDPGFYVARKDEG